MKKNIVVILTFIILISTMAFADVTTTNIVEIIVDGDQLNTYDDEQGINTPAFIYNNRTMMPLRMTLEMFGITGKQITWHPEDKTITVNTSNHDEIWMQIDNPIIKFNGKEMTFDVPTKIFNNRTYVPIAMISSLLDEVLVWDGVERTVSLNPSTQILDRFKHSFVLNRRKGFSVLTKVSNVKYELVKELDTEIYEIAITDLNVSYAKSFDIFFDEYKVFPENFIHLSDLIKSAYYEIEEDTYVVVYEFKGNAYKLYTNGLTVSEMKELVDSIEEVK